jgi:hypothetical protein
MQGLIKSKNADTDIDVPNFPDISSTELKVQPVRTTVSQLWFFILILISLLLVR